MYARACVKHNFVLVTHLSYTKQVSQGYGQAIVLKIKGTVMGEGNVNDCTLPKTPTFDDILCD